MAHHHHFLVVTFPAQGHINPALQFAKRLLRLGVAVTFATSDFTHRRMTKTPLKGLSYATFADGNDTFFKPGTDASRYFSELRRCGLQSLPEIIKTNANKGRPITYLVYTLLVPWAAEVAREFHIPCALLFVQPATVFDIYYYYLNGYGDVIRENSKNPLFSIEFPSLPLKITTLDLPSNLVVLNSFALPVFEEHMKILGDENYPKVLVNTFDDLESEALKAIHKFDLIGIGPLIPSAFLDSEDLNDNSVGGDLFQSSSRDYIEWLNSKPKSSVIYVSFGSISVLSKQQNEEILRGLIDSHMPFLWVIRANEEDEQEEESCRNELDEQRGMIVPWCCQVEVLSHLSVGCFVTHCGWNSTMESLVCGVPVVAFPQWADQLTNAKLIEDVWKTGVRVDVKDADGVVEGEEIKRCLEIVMGGGERGERVRKNAEKWKELAREAVKEGGSSDLNLKAFVEEVCKGRCIDSLQ